jgi:hypothetical protein
MFAGKWLLHLLAAGHYFMAPLAWLPFVLLALEPAVRRGSVVLATLAGVAFALIVLGSHPQVTFYAGVFVAVWSLGPALESAGYLGGAGPRSRRQTAAALGRWLGCGAWAALVAVALSAVGLWPAVEAAREATRGVGVEAATTPLYALWVALRLVGPSLGGASWEGRGALGVLWPATAALAPLLRRGRVRFDAAVLVGLVIFAVGGGALLQGLPGFRLFQLHSRMLLPAALPLALLAGTAVQALLDAPPAPARRRRARRAFLIVAAVAVLLAVAAAASEAGGGAALDARAAAWAALVVVAVPLLWRQAGGISGTAGAAIWGGALLAELWLPAWPLVELRPVAEVYRPAASVRFVFDHTAPRPGQPPGRVLDRGLDALPEKAPLPAGLGREPSISPLNPGLALVERVEAVRGYNSLDVRRTKEYLQMIAGGDGPVQPRTRPFGFPILADFPIKERPLLDLLGVRFLLQPDGVPPEGDGWRRVLRDEAPEAYLVITGGRRVLPPFVLYANESAFPRAFVVPRAEHLPAQHQRAALSSTPVLEQTVFLEGWDGQAPPTASPSGFDKERAHVVEERPNRVVVETKAGQPGYLVLADVWYPGWGCTVDGRPATVYRADYLFRAVELPEGEHTVEFTFDPDSYRRGRVVSLVALAGVLVLLLVGLVRKRLRGHLFL